VIQNDQSRMCEAEHDGSASLDGDEGAEFAARPVDLAQVVGVHHRGRHDRWSRDRGCGDNDGAVRRLRWATRGLQTSNQSPGLFGPSALRISSWARKTNELRPSGVSSIRPRSPCPPAWGHLRDLHQALRLCKKALLWGAPTTQPLQKDVEARVFELPEQSVCLAFLSNHNIKDDVTVAFRGQHFFVPRHSISILPDCKTVVFSTYMCMSSS
jgi:hypothetical protein